VSFDVDYIVERLTKLFTNMIVEGTKIRAAISLIDRRIRIPRKGVVLLYSSRCGACKKLLSDSEKLEALRSLASMLGKDFILHEVTGDEVDEAMKLGVESVPALLIDGVPMSIDVAISTVKRVRAGLGSLV